MIGLIAGIVKLSELRSDDPEPVVCCVGVGQDVEVPVVEVGNPPPDPKIAPRPPDDVLELAGVGLGVGDASPLDPPLDGILPLDGVPPDGREPPLGGVLPDGSLPLLGGAPPGPLPLPGCCLAPSADGNAVGVTANELLFSAGIDTSAAFSSGIAASPLMPGLAFWINASEEVAWLKYTTTSIASNAKKITKMANTLRFIGFHK